MRIRVWIFGLLLPLFCLGGEEGLTLRVIPSPNLVCNADFSQLNENRLPVAWHFDNCSKSPEFKSQVANAGDGNFLAVNTEWIKFGYWMQGIPVKEGVSYYVSCDVQSDGPTPAIWIECNAMKSSAKKSPGKLRYIISRSIRHGDDMRRMLRDFVDEELINNLSPVRWNRLDSEVIIPIDRGIEKCVLRIGIYGGDAGQARFRNPVFREAKAELKAEISGLGWTELRVSGANPEKVKLDPALGKQEVSLLLPKAPDLYRVELMGPAGRSIVKEVSNE